ncbi:probable E3 ubiquitin-protein ligase HERC4 isoform X1 [Ylistrum balloti]|uniref:probable E3 ubiquitin-protein ligase HERC4 isoform X1 n=1 Tax=Ylistrum balloti TaxID=509963 RepID=UPI002905CE5A|nr:probable E3 ubiquitin-protein ligase HERC4 isoform X1 [Ylistrum balloti]XP_060067136.1 probable E3 ubiquitin-protein ligase HERC4 isoform X1 [Ylistrum balloti]
MMKQKILGWGSSQHGQLAVGASDEYVVSTPTYIPLLSNEQFCLSKISCGEMHSLFVTTDGSIFSCGNNDYGQLGREHRRSKPEKIEQLGKMVVTQAAAGSHHSLALTAAGEVFSWGDNSSGQLGRGQVDEAVQRIPKLIKALVPHPVVQIACGSCHCLVLTDDGQVFSWGGNSHGQLGQGIKHSHLDTPKPIVSLKGIPIAQVVTGGSHSFVLSMSTAVFGWGKNCFGQLGLNEEADQSHPMLCKSLRGQRVKYICCGADHTAVLTQEGGVFTFGAGGYGQLGHNSTDNEILPKKVVELMGSKVTQIACGRRHTLSYVPNSGRVYAFGLGGSGQLGIGVPGNKTIPFPVQGAFISAEGKCSDVMDHDQPLLVKELYAGGDHCFIIAAFPSSDVGPTDYREHEPTTQIARLTPEMITRISKLEEDDNPLVFFDEVVKIFSTASCLNASFLLEQEHYGCSSKNPGVDMTLVRECMHKLGMSKNTTVIQKITLAITRLLSSLPPSPPDVEALRLYLILTEFHLFDLPKHYLTLIAPFGKCIMSLDKAASKVLDIWWSRLKNSFFSKIVYIYKQVVIYVLQLNTTTSENEMSVQVLKVSLEVLKKLNAVNEQHGQIIPYHQFYVSELRERVDIERDYLSWLYQPRLRMPPVPILSFCDYPFVFDGAAKSLLMQTDANMQMRTAYEEVHRRNIQSILLPMTIDPVSPCLVLYVSRTNIVGDTIAQIMMQGAADFKKPLKVIFVGEEAVDEGGVKKEFFMLLLREVLDPKYGMFKYYEETRVYWFNPMTFEGTEMFHMIGCLCGLAIYNSTIIQLDFPLALYKKLLKRPVNIEDLRDMMPTVSRGMEDLLDSEDEDIENTFCLTFEITMENFGEIQSRNLVPGGSHKAVTKENRQEYVDAYIDFIFNKSVDQQFQAFSNGFHKVCGGKVLELFHPQELQAMVVGNENYDFHELEKNTDYKGDYHRYHPTIKLFWEVFHDLSLELKKKFLLYLTGSDRIPILGMKSIKMVIQPMLGAENHLPVAHTCFNVLDLPTYNSKEVMLHKLQQAIEQTEGFGLV